MNVVVLSGGFGNRLWPLSRQLMPKQFLKLFNGRSLFQMTIERNKQDAERFIIVTNDRHFFIAYDQIKELNLKKTIDLVFILEEEGRNTAASIAFASQYALNMSLEDSLIFVPSDHILEPISDYITCLSKGFEVSSDGFLTIFGVEPKNPSTGYGYIEVEVDDKDTYVFEVNSFREKPDFETAKKYIEYNRKKKGKRYYWNSGIFIFKPSVYMDELRRFSPDIYNESLKVFNGREIIENRIIRLKNMENIPSISVDYAVIEKSKKVKMVKASFNWEDVGSFDSLAESGIKTRDKVIELNCRNNFVYSDRYVATIDIEDTIIIDSNDALLLVKKGSSQKVKDVIDVLAQKEPKLLMYHSKVYRPWGTYEVLTEGKNYKIKRIVVNPGKRLSLQKHFHRNEHWIVVSGTAEIEVDGNKFLLRPNESTYIKMGHTHRLSNPGKIPVVLIEVQTGEYVKEDDIVRILDDYFNFFSN